MSNNINIYSIYGNCLNPSDEYNRLAVPGADQYGNGKIYAECLPSLNSTLYSPPTMEDHQNKVNSAINDLDTDFFNKSNFGLVNNFQKDYTDTSLQEQRRPENFENSYVDLAAQMLNINPDFIFIVFFSDTNIEHLRNSIVSNVKEISSKSKLGGSDEGITIQQPNVDDFFNYMIKTYQNYRIYNGSICFINVKNSSTVKEEISKLNTNVLQEYVSKMISQIRMYIHYYKDASQIPEQLSLPVLTSMKGSKSLEYNTGFSSGDSIAVAAYNETGNII